MPVDPGLTGWQRQRRQEWEAGRNRKLGGITRDSGDEGELARTNRDLEIQETLDI